MGVFSWSAPAQSDEGFVGPMIEHVRDLEAFLERHPDTEVRVKAQLDMGNLLLRAFDAWHDAKRDVKRGGYDLDDSYAFLREARVVYYELMQSDDVVTREQARTRLYEIDLRESIPLIFNLEGSDAIFDFEGYRTHSTEILTIGPGQATIWVESLLPTTSGERLREPIELTIR